MIIEKCPCCDEPIEITLTPNLKFTKRCGKCGAELTIETSVNVTLNPTKKDQCYGMSCDKCSIMKETENGSSLPRCLYYEKSAYFLGMTA